MYAEIEEMILELVMQGNDVLLVGDFNVSLFSLEANDNDNDVLD